MPRNLLHREKHNVSRIGWLRAAVLGANDGIISTASLLMGIAAANAGRGEILVTGAAALIAGAMSMAAGEYVSVSSQADTEKAELEREARELAEHPEHELNELAHIYEKRGVEPALALNVATQLMAKDGLGSHARDELGISETVNTNPLQAALTSALTFSAGAAAPLLVTLFSPVDLILVALPVASLLFLGLLGYLGAWAGGAPLLKSVFRVVCWGAIALGATAGIGSYFGTVI